MGFFEKRGLLYILMLSVSLILNGAFSETGCCGESTDGSCSVGFFSSFYSSGMLQQLQLYRRHMSRMSTRIIWGLYGENCSETCPYPSFGANCISTCVCGESICNAATGCLNHSKTQITENTDIFTSHTVFLAVTVALGLSLLVIILLVVLLYHRHHLDGILNVQSHEQQLDRQQERDSRTLIRHTVRNTYRSINSVLGNPKPDILGSISHPILEKEDSYKCMTATKQKEDIQTAGTEQYEQLNLGDAATDANENCS